MIYRTYNPWVFANYGQPQRQRGYVSPVVYKSHYPVPHARMPAVRRWKGDPWFSDPLGVTVEEMHSELRKGTVLTYVGLGLSILGLYLSWVAMKGKK